MPKSLSSFSRSLGFANSFLIPSMRFFPLSVSSTPDKPFKQNRPATSYFQELPAMLRVGRELIVIEPTAHERVVPRADHAPFDIDLVQLIRLFHKPPERVRVCQQNQSDPRSVRLPFSGLPLPPFSHSTVHGVSSGTSTTFVTPKESGWNWTSAFAKSAIFVVSGTCVNSSLPRTFRYADTRSICPFLLPVITVTPPRPISCPTCSWVRGAYFMPDFGTLYCGRSMDGSKLSWTTSRPFNSVSSIASTSPSSRRMFGFRSV